MSITDIIRREACTRIIKKDNEKIARMLSKMQPDYKEQQRQNMKKFVRSL